MPDSPNQEQSSAVRLINSLSQWLSRNRKTAILGGIVIILGGSIAVVSLSRRPATPTKANGTAPAVSGNSNGSAGANRFIFQKFSAPPGTDTDHDGLSDEQEHQFGTDPKLADTDKDGLTDYEEVSVYHTNPLKSDTDGDGVSDGQEVRQGTNPLGPGTLRDLPQAIQQLQKK